MKPILHDFAAKAGCGAFSGQFHEQCAGMARTVQRSGRIRAESEGTERESFAFATVQVRPGHPAGTFRRMI